MSYHFILKNTLSYELFSNDVFSFFPVTAEEDNKMEQSD